MRKLILCGAALLPLVGGTASAQGVTPAAAREVAVELRENGKVVATSHVRLQLGRLAAISMRGPYAMRLRVDEVGEAGYTVRPTLSASGPDGWTPLRAPALIVPQGQRGRARVERDAGAPLEIYVSVN
jgi:hypothetical protein